MSDNPSKAKSVVLSAFITAALSLTTGLLLFHMTQDRTLEYWTQLTESFSGDRVHVSAFRITIVNSGKKELEELICTVDFPSGTKVREKSSPTTLEGSSESLEESHYSFKTRVINPGESFNLSFLLDGFWPVPSVSVRAKGAVGDLVAAPTKWSNAGVAAISIMMTTLGALLGSLGWWCFRERPAVQVAAVQATDLSVFSNVSEHTRDVWAHALFSVGDATEGRGILLRNNSVRHWSESDRLTAEASVGDSQTRQRCSSTIQVVLEIAGEGMHPLSRDILRFNLAKIALLQGDEDDAIIWLNDALAGERKELLRRFRRDGVMQQLAVKKRTTLPVKTAKALLSLGSISAIARSGDR